MTSEQAREIVEDATSNADTDVKDVGARRGTWIAFGVLLASIAIAALWFGPRLIALGEHSAQQDDRISELAAQADKNAVAGQALADQLRALGATPVVEPAKPGVVTQPVSVDPVALRQAAQAAVFGYCATNNQCRGADGTSPDFTAIVNAVVPLIPVPKDGTDGKDASDEQAARVVAAYCGQPSEPCRGPAGPGGTNGTNGTNGADGPACPSGYELRDAVITAPDGSTYPGKACGDPTTATPPSSTPDPPSPTPQPGG